VSELLRLPGLRTLASARFRMLVAAVLWSIGVALLGAYLMRSAGAAESQVAIDFADYHAAALAPASGQSLYAPALLAGPVPAQGLGAYRYPPILAELLAPLSGVPMGHAAALWFVAQAGACFLAVWLAGGAGGARPSGERLLWTGVAATYFLPVFDTLWKGNVSGFLALGVALVLAAVPRAGSLRPGRSLLAGQALALVALVKLTPMGLAVPVMGGALRGTPGSRGLMAGGLIAGCVALVPSLLLAPAAWSEYARVLPNLLTGSADYATNLAPAGMLATRVPQADPIVPLVRGACLAVGLCLIALGWFLARRQDGWQSAIIAALAGSLLLPAATWYHYLAVLLPVAALAWPSASTGRRLYLFAGAVLIYAGFGWWLPLALPGAVLLIGTAMAATWPARASLGVSPTLPARDHSPAAAT
jgi:Glycosyltransferase family 87